MKTALSASAFLTFVFATLVPQPGRGQLYYDTNGATPGTSTSSTQNLTDMVWTTDPTGASATGAYVPDDDLVFSAGTNGTGTQQVTVTDSELVDGFTFDDGTVTLLGSGSPNLSIGAGGITANSPDGATTFDSSLGTLTLSASQQWSVGTANALNVNSALTGSGVTLTTAGLGAGAVNLNGMIGGNVNLDITSTTSTVFLNSESNGFGGAITVDGGTLVYQNQGSLNNNNITLSDGGTLESATEVFSTGNDVLSNNITLGVGGGKVGDVGTSGTDMIFSGTFTGGTGLTIVTGDFLTQNDGTSDVGSLTVAGGRLLAGSAGLFGNNATVDVKSGAILDFGWNNYSGTLDNAITLESGSFLENRGPGFTLTDVLFPTLGTVTLGSDDVGGGSITITNNINLSNTLTLDINGKNSGTGVYLNGDITGNGALVISPGPTGISALFLGGAGSNYTGTTTIDSMVVQANVPTGFGNSSVTANSSSIYLTGGTISNAFTAGTGFSVIYANGSDLNLTGPIELSGNGGTFEFANVSTTGNMSVGSIDFAALPNTNRSANFDEATGAGSITLTGTYTSLGSNQSDNAVAGGSTLVFGDNGNGDASYYLSSSADFSQLQTNGFFQGQATITLDAGTLYVDNSTFTSGQLFGTGGYAGTNHTIALVGAQQIAAQIYFDEKHGPALTGSFTLEQTTADESAWNGTITLDSTQMIVSAVAGSRLDIDGQIVGSSPTGLIKTGAGTVVFANPSGNSYGLNPAGDSVDADAPPSPVDIDIQQGTLLVNNTQAGALGNNSGTVNIEAGATLGGTGNIDQQVVSMDPTAILTAGDPGQKSLGIKPTIGSLALGGLSAPTGLTMAFTLDENGHTPGTDNDFLTIGTLSLNGTVTIDITTVDGYLETGVVYTLISGTPYQWTAGSNLTFVFNLPDGYILDPNYARSGGAGYIYDTDDVALVVQFALAPEPATYALLAFGLLGLVVLRRFRPQSV